MRAFIVSAWLIAAALLPSSAFAWGDVGHRVICQIAYEEHPCPVADRCVISAILNDTRDLALRLDVSDQLRLLKSLGHWVGDIHQPLHVSFDDDRGGNLVAIAGSCKANLHAVWDKCIIEKKIGLDYADIAEKLRAEITDADRASWIPPEVGAESVVSWANGSFAITTRPDVQYCVPKEDACWYLDADFGCISDDNRLTFSNGISQELWDTKKLTLYEWYVVPNRR